MDTLQIVHMVNSLSPIRKRFTGVYPADKVNKMKIKEEHGCIINTAPSTHHGEHWIAVFFAPSTIEYFDSYGLKPSGVIKSWLLKTRKRCIRNRKRVQGLFTATCGAHCIYYLFHRTKGHSMSHIVKNQSDDKVTHFINSVYSPDIEMEETLETESINQVCKALINSTQYSAFVITISVIQPSIIPT